MKLLQETRRNILEQLKLNGPLTADELSEALEITSMGIRQHLKALEHDDFIEHEHVQRGMGRPSYVYALTEQGDELFPRTYLQMANSLLDALVALDGEEGINRIFEQRTENLTEEYRRRMDGKELAGAVAELAQIRTEEGYMADWEALEDGSYILREHNCSICKIASKCQSACSYELKLFKDVLDDVEIKRQDHMIKGDRMCSYVIKPQTGNVK